METSTQSEFYQWLYDRLYATGYHQDETMSHTIPVLKLLDPVLQYTSALDVGCSIGNAVKFLSNFGIPTQGVDISAVAIETARKRNLPCQVSCATKLPFGDGSFDLVISTDVLEHLVEQDIPVALREMTRVSKKYVVFKPSPRAEVNRTPLAVAKERFPELESIEQLHLTVRPIEWYMLQMKPIAEEFGFVPYVRHEHVFSYAKKEALEELQRDISQQKKG